MTFTSTFDKEYGWWDFELGSGATIKWYVEEQEIEVHGLPTPEEFEELAKFLREHQ